MSRDFENDASLGGLDMEETLAELEGELHRLQWKEMEDTKSLVMSLSKAKANKVKPKKKRRRKEKKKEIRIEDVDQDLERPWVLGGRFGPKF